jgi:hypothetical protein
MRTREKLKRLAILFSPFLLTGCGTVTSGISFDSGCQSFKPINGSTKDTTQTKRQIVAHNKVYDALCEKGDIL